MSKSIGVKIALVGVLLLAGVVAVSKTGMAMETWLVLGLTAIGIANAVFSLPGTAIVRFITVTAILAALLLPPLLGGAVILVWLVWPPAFFVAWLASRGQDDRVDTQGATWRTAATRSRIALAAIIGAVAIASLAYRLLVMHRLEQTAALFVGIPTLMAIVVVFGISPRSATGVICKAVTIGLLVSLVFLGEGVLCVLMSAPLFYAVAVLIGVSFDLARRHWGHRAGSTVSCVAALIFLPMSLEGVFGNTSVGRDESVTATRIVDASAAAVGRAIFDAPRFDRPLPLYLRAGFPRPVSARIDRGVTATRWIIRVRGGEMRLDGIEPRAGDLTLESEEERPGFIRMRVVGDDSHMTHYLAWSEVLVAWEAVDDNTTKVVWTLRYRRSLDPAWYFGPLERYAAKRAAGYLIDAVATP